MINAQHVIVGVDRFGTIVRQMVQSNIDENIEVLDANVLAAAEQAAAELKETSAVGDSWRGWGSIVQDIGSYKAGWQAYHYKPRKDSVLAIVAQANYPTITHLLEEGHELFFFGRDTGRRLAGNQAIATAYKNAVPTASGGLVK